MGKKKEEPKAKLVAYVPELLYEIPEREPIPEKTQVISELAVRLLELRETEPTAPILLMTKLTRLYRKDPFACWLAVEVLAGDNLQGQSLAELGRQEKESKQATHQRQHRALNAISSAMPEVADALRSILSRKGNAGVDS